MVSTTIPRYSRNDFIVRLASMAEEQGFRAATVQNLVLGMRLGSIGLTRRKAENTMDMLELDDADRSEFRRHFYGGD